MTVGGPAADLMFLSAVMPAYNEEQAIETVMQDHFQLLEKLSDQVPRWEVVCVDDASRDRTPEILRILSEREPRVRLVRHETNQGIFAARTGGKATGGSWKNIRDSLRDLPRCLVVYGVRRR